MTTRSGRERELKVGDHAYVAPPFNQRAGSPFLLVRIIDLPATPTGETPKARVSYYLRRRDVTNRSLADHRVVFATFMDGTVPLAHIRGKVQVMHRDYLEDPEAFKRQDDAFVFSQIYDRFMHKPFDLIPTSRVMNAPDHVLGHLRSSYEFVCTELGTSAELCDAMRGCVACHSYASKDSSVTCTICSKTYHLGCVEPPLPRKPALGWKWSCIKCTMEQEETEESDSDTAGAAAAAIPAPALAVEEKKAPRVSRAKKTPQSAPVSNGKLDKGKGPAVQPQLDVAKWKMTKGWPYRYFGQHVQPESVLDPHDPIWPRASTRVGTRFQVLELPGDVPDTARRRIPPPKMPKRGRAKKMTTTAAPEPERGEDESGDFIWRPEHPILNPATEEYLNSLHDCKVAEKRGNVDVLVQALRQLGKTSTPAQQAQCCSTFQPQGVASSSVTPWSPFAKEVFDQDLAEHEDELGQYSRAKMKKSNGDVVHRFYREKGYETRFMHQDDPARDKFTGAGPQGIDAEHGELTDADNDDDQSSLAGDLPTSANPLLKRRCAFCHGHETKEWYKAPDGTGDGELPKAFRVMCDVCAVQWRHYGNARPSPADAAAEAAREENNSNGQIEDDEPDDLSDSPPSTAKALKKKAKGKPGPKKSVGEPLPRTPGVPVRSCVICKRPEPRALTYVCKVCNVAVHAACYGVIPDADYLIEWTCNGCESGNGPDEYENQCGRCVCCPRDSKYTGGLTALDAYKVVQNRYTPHNENPKLIHLLCALWHFEVLLTTVDGELGETLHVNEIEEAKTVKECAICKETEGAVVKCEGCDKNFHVSCAWSSGYRFVFEIMQPKEIYAHRLPKATYKTETGDMRPVIFCKGHPWVYTRLMYDVGQRDRERDLTALMTFAKYMKHPEVHEDYPFLRKVRMLDADLFDWAPELTPEPRDGLPDNIKDVYETKAPYIKPEKKKRARKAGSEASTTPATAVPPATASSIAENGSRASSSVPTVLPSTSAASSVTGKKRKRKVVVDKVSESEHSSLSEDEVMPSATTSRARNASRPGRGVTLQDILNEENGDPPTSSATISGNLPKANGDSGNPKRPSPAIPAAPMERVVLIAPAPAPRRFVPEMMHRPSQPSSQQSPPNDSIPYSTATRPRSPPLYDLAHADQSTRSAPIWQPLTLHNLTHARYNPLYAHEPVQSATTSAYPPMYRIDAIASPAHTEDTVAPPHSRTPDALSTQNPPAAVTHSSAHLQAIPPRERSEDSGKAEQTRHVDIAA